MGLIQLKTLKNSVLFAGMSEDEITKALAALSASQRRYEREEYILIAGDTTNDLAMVLSGSITVESTDLWGNRTILSHMSAGDSFAEVFALLKGETVSVDVRANENSEIAFFDMSRLQSLLQTPQTWLVKFLNNLLMSSIQKNKILSARSSHTAPKSARARIMAYLNSVALKTRRTEFSIPFDRQQMADYLNLDRTALSKELSRMQNEGLIEFKKNRFRILR